MFTLMSSLKTIFSATIHTATVNVLHCLDTNVLEFVIRDVLNLLTDARSIFSNLFIYPFGIWSDFDEA